MESPARPSPRSGGSSARWRLYRYRPLSGGLFRPSSRDYRSLRNRNLTEGDFGILNDPKPRGAVSCLEVRQLPHFRRAPSIVAHGDGKHPVGKSGGKAGRVEAGGGRLASQLTGHRSTSRRGSAPVFPRGVSRSDLRRNPGQGAISTEDSLNNPCSPQRPASFLSLGKSRRRESASRAHRLWNGFRANTQGFSQIPDPE